ncbi:hypothetical protein ACTMTF_46670 [Nonomuraea sp. ZG12]
MSEQTDLVRRGYDALSYRYRGDDTDGANTPLGWRISALVSPTEHPCWI